MFYCSDEMIDRFIAEDVPYVDLTTWILDIGGRQGTIEYFSREEAVLCGSEEAVRIMEKLNLEVNKFIPSGKMLVPDEVFLEASGTAQNLHTAWKVCLNILDNCSGIATGTKRILDAVHKVNPDISILTTRKSFPGIKPLATKAVMMGGAIPHRLGLSETVLIFRQHMEFLGGIDALAEMIPSLKNRACEKKIVAEADSLEEGRKLCIAGIDGIQFDKLSTKDLAASVKELRKINPAITLLAAGGINAANAVEYAQTGVNGLVTTSMFYAKPIDMGVRMKNVQTI